MSDCDRCSTAIDVYDFITEMSLHTDLVYITDLKLIGMASDNKPENEKELHTGTDKEKNQNVDPQEYYKHLSLFWMDLMYLMSNKPQALSSTGPMRAMAANSKKIAAEIIDMNEGLIDFNRHLATYYKQLTGTWVEAQRKVDLKAPDLPMDPERFEVYKRVWIDIFDNDFTELFDSEQFGANYGMLVSKELEMTNHWNNISNVILKSANLPSRHDLDEVYKELHSLRRRVSKMENDKRRSKNARKSK